MAKKADNELADPFERVLKAEVPGMTVSKSDPTDPVWTGLSQLNGWEVLDLPYLLYPACVHESTIDLSGYANQHLTYFPSTAFFQSHPSYRVVNPTNTGVQQLFTLITSVPLDLSVTIEQLVSGSAPGLTAVRPTTLPANSNDFMDFDQVLFCQLDYRFSNNTLSDPTFMFLQARSQVGSLAATAADKLYVYVIAVAGGPDVIRMTVPSLRVGLTGTMAEEPTTEYLMRQLNSYQLANQV